MIQFVYQKLFEYKNEYSFRGIPFDKTAYRKGKNNMEIKKKTPDKILINTAFLTSAITQDREVNATQNDFESSKNIFFALLGGLISCILTLPSWDSWNLIQKWGIGAITVILTFVTLWFLLKFLQAKRKLNSLVREDLEQVIISDAKEKIRYTALLIVSTQDKETGEVKLMTEKQGNYLIHCDMDSEKGVNEQQDNIKNYLATSYNVPKNQITDIIPFSTIPFFTIKPIHGEYTQNGFVFFQIKLKKKAKQNLTNHRLVSWMSIHKMEGTPELMGRNQDIVMALSENQTKISDSFEESNGPIHIIWNITKACPYNCAICATQDNARQELSTVDKLQVLNHIFSAKDSISTLDFAGGDPMYSNGIRNIIMQAINSLGEEHVSITTTGKGIQAINDVSEEEIAKLLKRCEITIDASHENLSEGSQSSTFSRQSSEYCTHNYMQIQSTSENIRYLMINIPLIDDDLNDKEIANLITKLEKLKHNYPEIQIEAQIIRLMPVGAFNTVEKDQYKKYQPINVAKKIKARIEGLGIPCRYHCSLRVLPEIGVCDNRCNMLERKIGIDCSGNVFACTWGAYLRLPENYNITQNPFYLGNLVSTELKSILSGQGSKTEAYKRISRDIANRTGRSYCEAVSWFFGDETENNCDPLSQTSS